MAVVVVNPIIRSMVALAEMVMAMVAMVQMHQLQAVWLVPDLALLDLQQVEQVSVAEVSSVSQVLPVQQHRVEMVVAARHVAASALVVYQAVAVAVVA